MARKWYAARIRKIPAANPRKPAPEHAPPVPTAGRPQNVAHRSGNPTTSWPCPPLASQDYGPHHALAGPGRTAISLPAARQKTAPPPLRTAARVATTTVRYRPEPRSPLPPPQSPEKPANSFRGSAPRTPPVRNTAQSAWTCRRTKQKAAVRPTEFLSCRALTTPRNPATAQWPKAPSAPAPKAAAAAPPYAQLLPGQPNSPPPGRQAPKRLGPRIPSTPAADRKSAETARPASQCAPRQRSGRNSAGPAPCGSRTARHTHRNAA